MNDKKKSYIPPKKVASEFRIIEEEKVSCSTISSTHISILRHNTPAASSKQNAPKINAANAHKYEGELSTYKRYLPPNRIT